MSSTPYIEFSNVFNPDDFNILDTGLTISTADLRYVRIGSFGVLSALEVSGNINCGSFTIGGSPLDLTYITGVSEGIVSPSKALIVNSTRDIGIIHNIQIDGLLTILEGGGVNFTSSNTIEYSGNNTTLLFSGSNSHIEMVGANTRIELQANNSYIRLDNTSASLNINSGCIRAHGGIYVANDSIFALDLNIDGHNGSTTGLHLAGTLITAVASELNYVDVPQGTAQASKALVLNGNRDISNINSLSATSLTGTLQSAAQPNITSIGTQTSLNALEYKLNGSVVDFSSFASNTYLSGVTPGTAAASKALILDATKNVSDINRLNATLLNAGRIELTGKGQVFYSVAGTSEARMYHFDNGDFQIGTISDKDLYFLTNNSFRMRLNGSGVDIFNHNGSTTGLSLNGTLITATAAELNYLDITTIGAAQASKALVADANRDIIDIRNLTATQLTGTLQTAAQTNITSVGTLSSLTVSGALNATLATAAQPSITSVGILNQLVIQSTINSSLYLRNTDPVGLANIKFRNDTTYEAEVGVRGSNAIGAQNDNFYIYYNSAFQVRINPAGEFLIGSAVASGTHKFNVDGNIKCSNLTGTISTASQPNITSVGTLVDKLTISSLVYPYIDLLRAGTGDQYPDWRIKNESGLIFQKSVNGAAYETIVSISDGSNFDVASHNGTTVGLKLGGTLVTAAASEINYVDVVQGAATASKALVLDSSGVIRFPNGSRTTNAIQWYGGTAFKETVSMYRDSDDGGLVIATKPITINKCSPLLTLLSGDGLNTGTHAAAKIEILRSVITNTRLVGLNVYTSGLFTAYDQGTPPWLSSGFGQYSQLYTSQGALNLACNTSDVSTYASSANILLTAAGQVCINTATPKDNWQLTVNKTGTPQGIYTNGNATVFKMENTTGSTTDRLSFEMKHNTTWEMSLGGSAHATAPDMLYWYNGGYRMCLTPSGRLGINTASPFAPLTVNGNATLTIVDIGTISYRYNVSNNTWTNLGGGPVSYSISGYFTSNIFVQNSVYTSSDRRLKTDITPLDVSLEHYKKIKPVSYRMKNELKTKLGFIAQDMLEVAQEVVEIGKNDELEGGYQYNIDYSQMTAINASAIQKLIAEVEELKKIISGLK